MKWVGAREIDLSALRRLNTNWEGNERSRED